MCHLTEGAQDYLRRLDRTVDEVSIETYPCGQCGAEISDGIEVNDPSGKVYFCFSHAGYCSKSRREFVDEWYRILTHVEKDQYSQFKINEI